MKTPRFSMQSLCLAALTLIIFYPSLRAPLNPVDDRAIVQWLYDTSGSSLWEVFTHTTDYFYRPLLLVTYLLDMKLWGAETSFMHLENVFLHVANVLLLFLCARSIFKIYMSDDSWSPFLVALLFAIHPINTEAVNWIAGRSDLLACLFVLCALLTLLRGLSTGASIYSWLSIALLVPGFFAKETAVFFVPAALVLIVSVKSYSDPFTKGLLATIKTRFPFLLPYLVLPLLYLIVRGGTLLSNDAGFRLVRNFFDKQQMDVSSVIQTSLTGLGFYAKKLVVPWPLNFTISQVSESYFWLGLILIPVLIYFFLRPLISRGFFLASFFVGSSAILVMVIRPAWTPVAERYLYIPSAFFCLAVGVLCSKTLKRFSSGFDKMMLLVPCFLLLAYTTLARNFIWQDNVTLFQDAVKKSPDFPFAKSVLAGLLIETGQDEKGKNMIRFNTAPEGLRNASFLDLNRAELLVGEGEIEEARSMILEHRNSTHQLYYEFQKLLVKVDEALLESRKGVGRREVRDELAALYLELSSVEQDPFYLYRLGQLYLREQVPEKAAHYFTLAFQGAPDGAHYKEAARLLAKRLSPP